MSTLSDKDLRNRIERFTDSDYGLVIDPLKAEQIQPSSIDLTLAPEFRSYDHPRPDGVGRIRGEYYIDIDNAKEIETTLHEKDVYVLYSGQFVLASTAERVEIPPDLLARVEGKSSLGRIGLAVHITAGYIDPGFRGKITLEMVNHNSRPIVLRAGKSICQLSVEKLTSPAEFPYGHAKLKSSYQDQTGVTASKYSG